MRRTTAPGSINQRYFDRNLDIGREGTVLLAENLNDFQEEIANTIERSGRTLDSGDDEQLSKSVVLTGGDVAQTIDGVKTFEELPLLPSDNPNNANHAVRRGYVDAEISALEAAVDNADAIDNPRELGINITAGSFYTPPAGLLLFRNVPNDLRIDFTGLDLKISPVENVFYPFNGTSATRLTNEGSSTIAVTNVQIGHGRTPV